MKLSEYVSQVRYRLQEPQATGRFGDTEIQSYVNQAQVEISDALELLVKSSTLTFGKDEAEKPLPRDLLKIQRASANGIRLRTTDPLYLDTLSPTWETDKGEPTLFYIQGVSLRLYPIPEEETDVILTHSFIPPRLEKDEDETVLPQWVDEGIILYALVLARDSDQDERANTDWQKWQVWLQRAEARLRHRTLNPILRVKAERATR